MRKNIHTLVWKERYDNKAADTHHCIFLYLTVQCHQVFHFHHFSRVSKSSRASSCSTCDSDLAGSRSRVYVEDYVSIRALSQRRTSHCCGRHLDAGQASCLVVAALPSLGSEQTCARFERIKRSETSQSSHKQIQVCSIKVASQATNGSTAHKEPSQPHLDCRAVCFFFLKADDRSLSTLLIVNRLDRLHQVMSVFPISTPSFLLHQQA
jgi:hypothetical protein